MTSRSAGLLLALVPVLGGCLLDATIEPGTDSTSGVTTSGAPTSSSVGGGVGVGGMSSTTSTTTSTTSSSAGGASGAGGAGGGLVSTCRNGELESTETCEDGNDVAGAGVKDDACTTCGLEAPVCGNSQVEPGEPCDHSGPDCATCMIPVPSACTGATTLVPGATFTGPTVGLAFGDPASISGCGGDSPDTTKVFTYQTGPFPEGILVSIENAAQAGFNPDPMMWIYAGCGTDALTCRRRYDNTRLSVRSGVVPPRTKLFLGVSDHTLNTPLNFDGTLRTYRNFWTFENDEEQWDFGASLWQHSGNWWGLEVVSNNMGPEQIVTAPPTYVGGLGTTVRVELVYGLRFSDVTGQLHVAFDGGAPVSYNLPITGNSGAAVMFDVSRPPNSEWLGIEVGFTNLMNQYADTWLYDVYVGPVP